MTLRQQWLAVCAQARRELGICTAIGECILVPAALIVLIAVLLIIGEI